MRREQFIRKAVHVLHLVSKTMKRGAAKVEFFLRYISFGNRKRSYGSAVLAPHNPFVGSKYDFIPLTQFVSFAWKYYIGFENLGFFKIHQGVTYNNNRVTHLYFASCCTIKTDAA